LGVVKRELFGVGKGGVMPTG